MDRKWWHTYGGDVDTSAELWTSSGAAAACYGLNHIQAEAGGGISKHAGTIRHGSNSGFQAVSLALHFGAAHVILLGYDLGFDGLRMHWHPDHAKEIGNPMQDRMRAWCKLFRQMADELPGGVRVTNASRRTALDCFPRESLDACLA